eukprot:g3555.t1
MLFEIIGSIVGLFAFYRLVIKLKRLRSFYKENGIEGIMITHHMLAFMLIGSCTLAFIFICSLVIVADENGDWAVNAEPDPNIWVYLLIMCIAYLGVLWFSCLKLSDKMLDQQEEAKEKKLRQMKAAEESQKAKNPYSDRKIKAYG